MDGGAASRQIEIAEWLREIFAEFGAGVVSAPLLDFSRLHTSVPVFCEVQPSSTEELSRIVRLASKNGIPIRTRGNGHALNGSSLPRAGELVIQTLGLSRVGGLIDGTVSAGGGCVLWTLRASLRSRGYSLPVLNAGHEGPTLGGYLSAGGFGPGSASAGGFWDNVAEVTIVDGEGQVRIVTRRDPLFPWLFGAMGQLGIVAEAKLDVITDFEEEGRSPFGRASARRASSSDSEIALPAGSRDEAGRLFWFSLFVPEASLEEAGGLLDDLEHKHSDTFLLRDRYTYFIRHRSVVAPLIWPEATSCYAVGSWGLLEVLTPDRIGRVFAFEADFMDMAFAHGYRRYVQSEVPSGPNFYERYFAPETYGSFRAKRANLDQHRLFNRGWVFDGEDTRSGEAIANEYRQ